jgi:glycosyltransferase involved in cell wall biosynthesis
MKIYTFHLLNDYSGSPKVLMQSIKAWVEVGHEVTVVTCKGREGFLSDLPGVNYEFFWYKLGTNKLLKILFLLWSQLSIFIKLIFIVEKDDLIYINTVLPFGAAFLGLVKRCRIIFHIHETSIKPILFKKMLFTIVELSSEEVIYVSKYLSQQEKLSCKKTHILHNAIANDFINIASSQKKDSIINRNVLMVCSLKAYKGINEFVYLSDIQKQYQFRLVVNANQLEIDKFFRRRSLPPNIEIFSTQTNLHPFYLWADVVLNLSRPDEWVETFGLTIIEAMAYGLPVIVPPVGGVTELVDNGVNGYLANCRNIDDVSNKLETILENGILYNRMKNNALKIIGYYKEDVFIRKSLEIIGNGIKNPIMSVSIKY